ARQPFTCHIKRHIKQPRSVRLKVGMQPRLKCLDLMCSQLPASALIGVSCIGKAITDHPLAGGQRGLNYRTQVFTTRCEHQQRFGFELHGLSKNNVSQGFAQFGTTGLSRADNIKPPSTKMVYQTFDVGAFACAVQPFKRHEAASLRSHQRRPNIYLATARLCATRVSENSLVPSPRDTK